MKKNAQVVLTAGILALGISATASAAPDAPKSWEKCLGVSKMAKNDCGATDGSHGCAGMAKEDNLKTEWVYVPEGTCEKLTGGEVYKTVPAKS